MSYNLLKGKRGIDVYKRQVFMSPSKAFNMPGLASSYAIIENDELRHRFQTLSLIHIYFFPVAEDFR